MATKKISELTELITIASDDILPIVDTSENETKSISVGNFIDKTIATQAEAETGTDNTKLMTPLRTKQAIRQDITTGTEFATNEWIDGKQVFSKIINCGTLPNNATTNTSTGLSNVSYLHFYGYAKDSVNVIPLPHTEIGSSIAYNVKLYINQSNNTIVISCGQNQSSFSGTVVIYYTKN